MSMTMGSPAGCMRQMPKVTSRPVPSDALLSTHKIPPPAEAVPSSARSATNLPTACGLSLEPLLPWISRPQPPGSSPKQRCSASLIGSPSFTFRPSGALEDSAKRDRREAMAVPVLRGPCFRPLMAIVAGYRWLIRVEQPMGRRADLSTAAGPVRDTRRRWVSLVGPDRG